MFAKGTAILPIPDFIISKFGYESYKKWLNSLTPEAKEVFSDIIKPVNLYPLKEIIIDPTIKLCELFYGGSMIGAKELGRYSADYSLTKMYRLFVKTGSPEYIIQRLSSILPMYYQPCSSEAVELKSNYFLVRVMDFPENNEVIEQRIAGWLERALEISGAAEPSVVITKSCSQNYPYSEFEGKWR